MVLDDPIHPAQQRAAVVAVWDQHEADWRFGVMQGCPFGLGSVVVSFNRYPTLITAALRRTLGLMAAAYFDDNLLMEFEHAAAQAKQLLEDPIAAAGAPPKQSKSHPMQWHRVFFGAIVDMHGVSVCREMGMFTLCPKTSADVRCVQISPSPSSKAT